MNWRERALNAEAAIVRLYEAAEDESGAQHMAKSEAMSLGIPFDERTAEFGPPLDSQRFVYIVFQPGESGPDLTFVDIENEAGESVIYGQWVMRGEFQALRLEANQ